ncbi:MAG: hypothetical protein ABII68_02210 [Pseudomonadota bacterium]
MKKQLLIYALSIIISFIIVLPGLAEEQIKTMDHSGHAGVKIHESTVQEYRLAFHLLDLPGREERHLMTYIKSSEGLPVTEATVGYLIKGPDNAVQKIMAMGMKDSFGGDVNFTAKGSYTIKVKAVVNDKKLIDEFIYEVK